jgi:hypothetical protein
MSSIVTPEEEAQYTPIIDDILANADLATISAKAIRKGIQTRVDHDISAKKVRAYAHQASQAMLTIDKETDHGSYHEALRRQERRQYRPNRRRTYH